MKKAAFFVEGQTELLFVTRLLREIAGASNIAIHEERLYSKSFLQLSLESVTNQSYFALVVDCCSDSSVASAILERHSRLSQQGYSVILGLRDLYPLTFEELARLEAGIGSRMPDSPYVISVVIAVAEVEAWFLQEDTHFIKISPKCLPSDIDSATGYNITTDLAETLPHPSITLNEAYKVGGKRYSKRRRNVSRTINVLDYEHLYINQRVKLKSFDKFVTHIEQFLT